MALTTYIGDGPDLSIPLTWQGEAFAPGVDWALIFTVKRSSDDLDVDALIQKASGAGIEVTNYTATVSLVAADTVDLDPGKCIYDVQAQNSTTGAVRTVSHGVFTLYRDVTRETTTSIPVNTTSDALPFGPTLPTGLSDITSIEITAGDDLEIVSAGVTYYLPLYRR